MRPVTSADKFLRRVPRTGNSEKNQMWYAAFPRSADHTFK